MRRGITFIEIIITIAIIALLAGIYFMVANPAAQLAGARNTQRQFDLQAIGNSIRANYADTGNESFTCSAGTLPASTTIMKSAAGGYNIGSCLVPTYMPNLPIDPIASSAYYNSPTDYNTGFAISQNASGVITLSAPNAELGKTISVTR